MNNIRILFSSLLMIPLVLSSGCDFASSYSHVVNNRTSDTLQFTFQGVDSIFFGLDTLQVPPFTDTTFYWREDDRLKEIICDPFFREEVSVRPSSGRTLTKDINDTNNWECFSENDFNDWFLEYTVEETDLE